MTLKIKNKNLSKKTSSVLVYVWVRASEKLHLLKNYVSKMKNTIPTEHDTQPAAIGLPSRPINLKNFWSPSLPHTTHTHTYFNC